MDAELGGIAEKGMWSLEELLPAFEAIGTK